METVDLNGGFEVPAHDTHIGRWQKESGRLDHDQFLVPLACSHIQKASVVIDVGAYNGDWTIALSGAVGPGGFVIAVEPNPEISDMLYKNAQRFQWQNVYVDNCALGAESGWCDFVPFPENFGMGHTIKNEHGKIRVKTLDDLARAATARPIGFIKIDAEGSEMDILKGAKRVLREDKPTIIMEINPLALRQKGASDIEVFEFLKDEGYVYQRLQQEIIREGDHFDILAMPVIFSEPSQPPPEAS